MRVLIIFGALLLGIIGLLMSVCGGGFLLMSLIRLDPQMLGVIFVFAGPSLVIGVFFVYKAVTITGGALARDETDANG